MIDSAEKNGYLMFRVKVVPRASRSEIAGELDGALRVRIAAPPVDGAANEELIKTLARFLNVPRGTIELAAGHSSRTKQVRVKGATQRDLAKLAG
ncbi:MAG TPA: DUF167 domain-containing protein [Pyrinomonadaceae bacterium]|nr:DUF167 domain-containing protein [Pyrinomonadaceae bacterium]